MAATASASPTDPSHAPLLRHRGFGSDTSAPGQVSEAATSPAAAAASATHSSSADSKDEGIFEQLQSVLATADRIDRAMESDPNRPDAPAMTDQQLEATIRKMHEIYGQGLPIKTWLNGYIMQHPSLGTKKLKSVVTSEKEAVALIKDIYVKTTNWHVGAWETWISGILAGVSAVCSAMPTFTFVSAVVDSPFAVEHFNKEIRSAYYNYAATVAFAQSSFISFNSGYTRFSHLLRYLSSATTDEMKKDFSRNKIPLTITTLSALVSFLQSWSVFKDSSPGLRWALSLGRFMSAMNTNGIFLTNTYKKIGGYKKRPELTIALTARDKLNKLAADTKNHSDYIKKLSNSGLFSAFTKTSPTVDSAQAKQNLDEIFHALLTVLGHNEPSATPSAMPAKKAAETATGARSFSSLFLGFVASLPYVGSGLSVDTVLDAPAKYAILVTILGYALSVNSVTANTTIIASGLNKFMADLSKAEVRDWKHAVGLIFEGISLLGKGTADAGMAIFSPIVDQAVVTGIVSLLTFITSLAVGHLSIDNFFNQLKNGYYSSVKQVLENAKVAIKNGGTLELHYNSLKPTEKLQLVNLLQDYLKWAFDSLADALNALPLSVANEIFSGQLKHIFHDFHTPAPTAAPLKSVLTEAPPAGNGVAASDADDELTDPSVAVGGTSLPAAFTPVPAPKPADSRPPASLVAAPPLVHVAPGLAQPLLVGSSRSVYQTGGPTLLAGTHPVHEAEEAAAPAAAMDPTHQPRKPGTTGTTTSA